MYNKLLTLLLCFTLLMPRPAHAGPPPVLVRLLNMTNEHPSHVNDVSDAILSSTSDKSLQALLIAQGWHESRFKHSVCTGEKLGDGGRAYGCWQSWDKDHSGGLRGQAWRAAEHLRRAGNYCVARGFDRIEGAISLYATGRTCQWSQAKERAATYRRVLRRL